MERVWGWIARRRSWRSGRQSAEARRPFVHRAAGCARDVGTIGSGDGRDVAADGAAAACAARPRAGPRPPCLRGRPHDVQCDDRSPPGGDRVLRRQRRRRRGGRLGAERGSPGGDPRRRAQRGRSLGLRRRPGDRSAAAGRGTGRSRVAACPGRRRSDVAQCRRVQRRTSAGDARRHLRHDRRSGPDPGRRDRPPDGPARPDPRQPGLGRGRPRRRHRGDCLGRPRSPSCSGRCAAAGATSAS